MALASNGASAPMSGGRRIASHPMHDHWRLFVVEGLILIVLGTAAVLVPTLASLAMSIILGWLFLVGGIIGLITSIVGRRAPGFWWSFISALVTLGAGGLLVLWPVSGAISLTIVLTAFLVADGILTIVFGIEHRRALSKRWGFLVANGLLDLVLAGIIVWAFPGSGLWVLGLIVGIDLIFGGYALVAMGFAGRTDQTF